MKNVKKLKEAFTGESITGSEEQLTALKKVTKMSFKSVREMFEFSNQPDRLVETLYGAPNEKGEFLYPPVPGSQVAAEWHPLGCQLSKYHMEDYRLHVSMVVAKVAEATNEDRLAILIAALHDIAKKYTFGLNKVGDVCFYGHEELGAYIVANWLHNMNVPEGTVKIIFAVIAAHLRPKVEWKHTPENKEMFREELAEFLDGNTENIKMVMHLINIIDAADIGVLPGEKLDPTLVERGFSLICEM